MTEVRRTSEIASEVHLATEDLTRRMRKPGERWYLSFIVLGGMGRADPGG